MPEGLDIKASPVEKRDNFFLKKKLKKNKKIIK